MAHRVTQAAGTVGQWAGAVRIVRSRVGGRPYLRMSTITGAGLVPRAYEPSFAPAGIPSNGSDGVGGVWGGETAGTDSFLTDHVVDCLQMVDIRETLR